MRMNSKLNLDQKMIDEARRASKAVADEIQPYIDEHTTVSVERTIARLLGIDGIDEVDRPLPNIIVNHVREQGGLNEGIAYWIGNAMVYTGKGPQEIAEAVSREEFSLTEIPAQNRQEVIRAVTSKAEETVEKIKHNRKQRETMIETMGEGKKPLLYLIVASGNIYEDVIQAQAAVRQGADIIAVIRSTAQSLLDYVPYGPTTEGFGGTYATQENFRIMRKALDEVGEKVGRYIRLCNYCSGLCMPEIAAMGALERLDVMLNDALYGILFRDINMQRTFVDQYFSRVVNGFAGIIINTGEDNYLTTADAVEEAHTVVASQFINEQFALKAGLPEEQMALGHAFEMDPELTNGFLLELAQAQMAREIFPKAPLKYMPPTKFMTGNIFKGHIQDAMFNLAAIWTQQGIQLLGMLTEANHTPHLHDRALSIENAKYVFNNCKDIGDEIEFKKDGIIQKRAQKVLGDAVQLLDQVEEDGILKTIEEGKFGGVKRSRTGGKGLDGVFEKSEGYLNPFIPLMLGGDR